MIAGIDSMKCNGCRICVDICNMDVIRLDTSQEEIPPCQAACPAGVDIRGYMYLLGQEDIDGAIRLIREALPLPAVTGHVCFHPCETECARKEVDESLNINSLERFIADYWVEEKAGPMPRLHVGKVAIVGSGPAGLSCAYFLIKMGYAVTVFESMSELGGMLRVGIPEYRLPRDILDAQINYIKDMGVEFRTNATIGKDLSIDDLKDRGYEAAFFAIGTQLSKKLEVEGIKLDGVLWALDLLRNTNLKREVEPLKDKVLVVGGGDVAMDAALNALRLGAKEVELSCLESRAEMPAHKDIIQQVVDEGININVSWGPKRILGEGGRATGVELIRCTSVFDKEGSFNPSFDEAVRKSIKADTVIFAIGQSPDLSLMPQEINITSEGTIATDPITLETGLVGIFAGGDAVSGPTSVVEAIASGKRASVSIDRYLKRENLKVGRHELAKIVEKPPKEGVQKRARQTTHLLPVGQRSKNFKEIRLGFNEEMAMIEVGRCMTCGSKARIVYPPDCMVCFECELNCPEQAVKVDFAPAFVTAMI